MITVIHLALTYDKDSRVVAIFPQPDFSLYFLILCDFTPVSGWWHFLIRWLRWQNQNQKNRKTRYWSHLDDVGWNLSSAFDSSSSEEQRAARSRSYFGAFGGGRWLDISLVRVSEDWPGPSSQPEQTAIKNLDSSSKKTFDAKNSQLCFLFFWLLSSKHWLEVAN